MHIIRRGTEKDGKRGFCCKECGCLFIADEPDWKIDTDSWGDSWTVCDCPECGHECFTFIQDDGEWP